MAKEYDLSEFSNPEDEYDLSEFASDQSVIPSIPAMPANKSPSYIDAIVHNPAFQAILGAGDAARNNLANVLNLIPGFNVSQVKSGQGDAYDYGKFGGDVLTAFAIPEAEAPEAVASVASKVLPKYGKATADYLTSILANAGIGGAISDNRVEGAEAGAGFTAAAKPLMAGLTAENPLIRALTGAGIAGGAEAAFTQNPTRAGEGTAAALGGMLPLFLKKGGINQAAAYKTFNDLKPEEIEQTIGRKKAAESLGINLTPAEASGLPTMGAQQAQIGTTPKSAKNMYQFGQGREQSEQKALEDLFDAISPAGAYEALEKPLYEKASQDLVPENELAKLLLSDERINNAVSSVANDIDYGRDLAGYPTNSIRYLDRVKKSLDDTYRRTIKKEGEKDRARLIADSRDKVVALADTYSPSYKQARAIAEKRLTRQGLENTLAGEKISGSNFFEKALNNDNDYNRLYKKLADRDNPEKESIAQTKLRAMKESFPFLIEPINAKVTGSLASSGLDKNYSPKSYAASLANNMIAGRYNEALAKLFTRSDWDEELKRIAQLKDNKAKSSSLASLLARVGAMQYGGNNGT